MINQVTYTIPTKAQTSARLSQNGKLVKPLWSNKATGAGKQVEAIDTGGLDAGTYSFDLLAATNVGASAIMQVGQSYNQQGGGLRIVNTHRGRNPISGVVYAQGCVFYTTNSTEGNTSVQWFDVNTPQIRQTLLMPYETTSQQAPDLCTDGVYVYALGTDFYFGSDQDFVTKFNAATKLEVLSENGVPYKGNMNYTYQSVLLLEQGGGAGSAGKKGYIAVQKNGDYLFMSDPDAGEIKVYNKNTLAFVSIYSGLISPDTLAVDEADNLIVNNGPSGMGGAITTFSVSEGSFTQIDEMPAYYVCGGLTFNEGKLYAVDATEMIVRIYQGGNQIGTFGEANGLLNNANTADNKYHFLGRGGLTFLLDGSFWLIDAGNFRMLHMSSGGTVLERIGYITPDLECQLNNNIVYASWKAWQLNLSNNTWQPFRNYELQVSAIYKQNPYFRIYKPTTKEGRTYCILWNDSTQTFDVADITSPQLRFTGRKISQANGTAVMNRNMDIIRVVTVDDSYAIFYIEKFAGLENNNPTWLTERLLVQSPPIPEDEVMPDVSSGGFNPDFQTADGTFIWFVSGVRGYNQNGFVEAAGAHLRGFKNSTEWLWAAQWATPANYYGPFREDDYYDIESGIQYASTQVQVIGEWIIEIYNGEFWRTLQTCFVKIFHQSGLMLGQFGVTKEAILKEGYTLEEKLQFVGNPRITGVERDGNDLILALMGESPWDAICLFRYTNVFACAPLSVPVVINPTVNNTAKTTSNQPINLLEGLAPGGVVVTDAPYLSYTPAQSNDFKLTSGRQSLPSDAVQSLEIVSAGNAEERSVRWTPPPVFATSYIFYGIMDFHRLGFEGGSPYRTNRLRWCDTSGGEKVKLRWMAYDGGDLGQFVLFVNDTPQPQFGRYGEQLLVNKKWSLLFNKENAVFQIEGFAAVTIEKQGDVDWNDSGYMEVYRANSPNNGNDTNIIMLKCWYHTGFTNQFFNT